MIKLLIPLSVLSFLFNVFLVYLLLDQSISVSHGSDQLRHYKNSHSEILQLLEYSLNKKSKNEIFKILQINFDDEKIIDKNNGCLYLSEVYFCFNEENELTSVSSLN